MIIFPNEVPNEIIQYLSDILETASPINLSLEADQSQPPFLCLGPPLSLNIKGKVLASAITIDVCQGFL